VRFNWRMSAISARVSFVRKKGTLAIRLAR
jgi:hypothetical protein